MKKNFISQKEEKVVLKEKSRSTIVDMEKITHLTCDGYLTTIHAIDRENVTVSKLLKHFEMELIEYGFIRANHNTIVNISKIDTFQEGKKRRILLIKTVEIKISRRKMYIFKTIFEN